MILHQPFIISAALAPALKIGTATLSLLDVKLPDAEGRDAAVFELQTEDFTYVDDQMKSGVGGYHGTVDIFEGFLGFMAACGESVRHVNYDEEPSENADLFPPRIATWCAQNLDEIEATSCSITDEDGNVNYNLIEE